MKYALLIFTLLCSIQTHAQQKNDNVILIETDLSPEMAYGDIAQILQNRDYKIDIMHEVLLMLTTKPKKVINWFDMFYLTIEASIDDDNRLKIEGKWIKTSTFGGSSGENLETIHYSKEGIDSKAWEEMHEIADAFVKKNGGRITYLEE